MKSATVRPFGVRFPETLGDSGVESDCDNDYRQASGAYYAAK